MWKVVAASAQGTSHLSTATECQDSHCCKTLTVGDEPVAVLVCADGAGSAAHSAEGSRLTCVEAARWLEQFLCAGRPLGSFEHGDALSLLTQIRGSIAIGAQTAGVKTREFACTLLICVVAPNEALFLQVGDGAIVARAGSTSGVVFWPQSGEYVNTTMFVTDADFDAHVQHAVYATQFSEVAMFTDGLERMVLDFAAQTPHAHFFNRSFGWLRDSADLDELQASLADFLNSPVVNGRTDDDKTLVLALRTTA